MFLNKKKKNSRKESRDVTLGDIATISGDMAECIKKSSEDNTSQISEPHCYNGEYEYNDMLTPPQSLEYSPIILAETKVETEDLENIENIENFENIENIENFEKICGAYGIQTEPTHTPAVKGLIIDVKVENDSTNSNSSRGRRVSPFRASSDRKYRSRHLNRHTSYAQETSDNHDRPELLWTTKIENVIYKWHNKCLENAEWHTLRAKYHKKIFYGLGIPAAIIPMILASLGEMLGNDWKTFITISLIITGILNIITGFLNPGKKAEAHLNFNSLYSQLAVEITSEMVKPQSYRTDADVFIQRIMDNYISLNNRSPES
jgi:hypothetical protein